MRVSFLATTGIALVAGIASAEGATFEWVTGPITGVTAQQPAFTVFVVGGKTVRFCHPDNGEDYAIDATNIHYDLLKTAFGNDKATVEVGIQNFGNDPQSGDIKRCIDRVKLNH